VGELFTQLADEHVDDLLIRLVHAAVELVKEHLFRGRMALTHRQEFQHPVFLASERYGLARDFGLFASGFTVRSPQFSVGSAWPNLLRTIAWMRAMSSALWKGLVT